MKTVIGRLNRTIVDAETTKIAIMPDHNRQRRLYRECWALRIAQSRGVLVPSVVDYRIDNIDGKKVEVLVLETIKGKTISFQETTQNIQTMRLVGQQLNLLNCSGNSGYGWPHPESLKGEFETWKSFLYFFIQKYGKRLLERDIVSNRMLNDLLEIVNAFDFKVDSSTLIHRDIKPANILNTPQGPYIIDWENSLLGDSLFDLAQYGANYGRTKLWIALADGLNVDNIENDKYILYETIALIGIIDFCRKQKFNYSEKKQRFIENLRRVT